MLKVHYLDVEIKTSWNKPVLCRENQFSYQYLLAVGNFWIHRSEKYLNFEANPLWFRKKSIPHKFETLIFFSIVTACIRRMGKVLFSQVSVCSQQGGTSVPGSFLGHWSQVLSGGGGYPSPGQGRGCPSTGQGGTPVLAGGYPLLGYPLARSGWGTPGQVTTPPPRDRTRASTSYATGVMPLEFMQEDFLVEPSFV